MESFSYQFVLRKVICWQLVLIVIQPCQFHLSGSNSIAAATQQLSYWHYLHIGIDRNRDLGIFAASAPLHHSLHPLMPQSHEVVTSVGCTLKEDSKSLQVSAEISEESFANCGWSNPDEADDGWIVRNLTLLISSDKRRVCWLETFHASCCHTDLSQPPALAVKDLFQILLFYAKPGTTHQNTLYSHHMTWIEERANALLRVGVFGSLCQSLRISDEWFMAHEDSSVSVIKFRLWQPFTSFALHSQPAPAAVVRRQGCDKSDGRTPKACAEVWEISHFSTHWRDWHQWSATRLNRTNINLVKEDWQFSASVF